MIGFPAGSQGPSPVSRVTGRCRGWTPPKGRGTDNARKAVRMRAYCSCGHVVDEHLAGGQCRASDEDGRCTCQSVDIDEAE